MKQDEVAEPAESLGIRECDIGKIRSYRVWLTPLLIAASGLLVILAYIQGFNISYVRNSYPFSIAVAAASPGIVKDRKPLFALTLVGLLCIVAFALGSILGARAAVYPEGIMYGVVDKRGLVAAQSHEQFFSKR